MTYGTYGDFARWRIGALHGTKIKSSLMQSSTELATGQKSDLAKHLGTETSHLSGIDAMLKRLESFDDISKTVRSRLQSQQLALAKVENLRQNLHTAAIGGSPNLTERSATALQNHGHNAFHGTVSALNTQTGGRFHFSGDQAHTRPFNDAAAILTDLVSTVDFTQSAGSILSQINDFFSNPTGPFATMHYAGGTASGTTVQIGEHAEIETSVTASDPQLRKTLAHIAGFAILKSIPVEKRNDFVAQLTPQIHSNTGIIDLRSQIGQREAAIQTERAEQSAHKTALLIERNTRIAADPHETAARLKQAEIQLELHYTMLSRMSKLSLVHFAR